MIKELLDTFNTECTYKSINKYNPIKLRNIKNGITLTDAIYYRFAYSNIQTTKDLVASDINMINKTSFSRQAYEAKDNNIPVKLYSNLLEKISTINNKCNASDKIKTISIDGSYSRNREFKEILNMGFFDINNDCPIYIESYGQLGKNKEVSSVIDFIKNNIDDFKDSIIICDRAYFCYRLFDFLNENNISYVIRARKDAVNLNPNTKLKKGTANRDLILKLRKTVRIVKSNKLLYYTVDGGKGKKNAKKYKLVVKDDCVLVTNLTDLTLYTNDDILDLYKSRWDIEVFFKYLKSNYKFRILKEKNKENIQKMYICEMLLMNITKIIEKYYINKISLETINNKTNTTTNIKKINKTHLTNSMFKHILYNIIKGDMKIEDLDHFCKVNIKYCINKPNRSFPRVSKTPFTKWYVKAYSNQSKYYKIINAILNNTVNELNKNLKTLASKIVSINGKKYG